MCPFFSCATSAAASAAALPLPPGTQGGAAAADLQGRALPAGAAAAQVGDHRGHKDHRHQENGQAFAELHGLDDGVGALPLQTAELIQPHDGKAPHRPQVQNPGVGPPDGRGVIDADMKQGAHHAAPRADNPPQQHPFE